MFSNIFQGSFEIVSKKFQGHFKKVSIDNYYLLFAICYLQLALLAACFLLLTAGQLLSAA